MINWKVRIKNKTFWITIIPAVLLLAQQVMAMFGVSIDTEILNTQLLGFVGSVFTILSLVGVVSDPTTKGISDSKQALEYEYPKED